MGIKIQAAEDTANDPGGRRVRATQQSPSHLWSDAAPARLRAVDPADDRDGWRKWQKHLRDRRRPVPLRDLDSGKLHPLLWNLPETADKDFLQRLLASGQPHRNGAANRNGTSTACRPLFDREWSAEDGPTDALAALAGVSLLPGLAATTPCESWWALLEALCDRAAREASGTIDEMSDAPDVWYDQLTTGELALALACQFPELQPCAGLSSRASATLSEGLTGLTDGEGLLHARHLPWLRPLLASWTRCAAMALEGGLTPWRDDAQVQYEWLVRQALRLTRSDGSQLLDHGPASHWQPELFRAALDLAGDDEDFAAASMSLPRDVKIQEPDEVPCAPATHSEWSRLAVLRSDWKRDSPRLAVSYEGHHVSLELEVGREVVLSGGWQAQVQSSQGAIPLEDDWEEVCWLTDDDVDYLELSARLSGGGRLDRQFLLVRNDRVLFLCDHIVDAPLEEIEYSTTIPLGESCRLVFEEETREGRIVGKKPRALLVPAALPEWRADSRFGELAEADGALHLHQHAPAGSLSCPLFLDLQPRRFARQRTWRQLTVAEALHLVPRDRAVAYRVQTGRAQWLFYRSLAPPANRTFFGQNVANEFFAARFHRDGEVEELLEIEG